MAEKIEKPPFDERMSDWVNDFDGRNPLVATKYLVVEGFYATNEYDYDVDWVQTDIFEFDSLEERSRWLSEHVPSGWREFRLGSQEIREMHPQPYLMRMNLRWETR